MTVEPLRSAISIGKSEDTSLALPSDNKLRTGQQRVLDQVFTIKRSKSKQLKNGSLSPTSPASSGTSESVTFKFSPTTMNGSVFGRSKSVVVGGHSKTPLQQKSRTLSTKTRRQVNGTGQWEQRFQASNWPQAPLSPKPLGTNGIKSSISDLALVKRATGQTSARPTRATNASIHSMTNAFVTSQAVTTTQTTPNRSQIMQTPSNPGLVETKISVVRAKTEVAGENPLSSMPDMTMREAVEYLSKEEGNYQLWGASYIQHSTFKEAKPKQEVLQLGGIPPLVFLLQNTTSQVQQTAAAALRNLVFKNNDNKLEVNRCGGTDEALVLLKETNSTFTLKQLTGLLWNLSSADELKPSLIKTALPVLTESIVGPYTCWSDTSVSNYGDPEVFHSATGCMRNLSCSSKEERQAMRGCHGLIDSIVTYVQSCVAVDSVDDMSVENCVCILHNLTYQLETEAPEQFSKFTEPAETRGNATKESSTIGCFSPKSKKIQQNTFSFPPMDENDSKGMSLLYHSKTIQTYLSLLGSSQKDATLEACCGALQNLTANKSQVSSLISQTIAQKLNGLQTISPLLKSPNPNLQKTTMSLLGNLSRTTSLHNSMVRQILPQLAMLVTSGPKEMGNCDDTVVTACNTVRTLLMSEPDVGKRVVTGALVETLTGLTDNRKFPKASTAASVLLYSLWDEKDIQILLKKVIKITSEFRFFD
ncbi:plakophilin-1 [Clupea harengus]|uniref:Plakophilin-1 n=1 Tax=Clupea harengus TaxID=7950 RepID=A0A8M1KE76_CLUHA|nr:plakophilin-1 [Clupea harengus]